MANKILIQPDYILLGEHKIFYTVRKSSRAKQLQMRIVNNSLELIIPHRVSVEEGKRFLHTRREWINKNINLLKKQEKKNSLFGNEINIEQSFNLFRKRHTFKKKDNTLFIESPQGSSLTVDDLFTVYRKHSAKIYLPQRTFLLARRLGLTVKRVSVRRQKSRWGSCSSKGTISLNDRLLEHKEAVIDYVIIHELCHLVHMNHSAKFWTLVEQYCPEYKMLKRQLKIAKD
ncbi:MAG: M48 family metallopeptidase [Ignavibacteriaceae bacterium]|nr:M48 family metallopeptidase [Ignavibacteriaceae bacterium]